MSSTRRIYTPVRYISISASSIETLTPPRPTPFGRLNVVARRPTAAQAWTRSSTGEFAELPQAGGYNDHDLVNLKHRRE